MTTTMTKTPKTRIAIVGAGFSGLYEAWLLSKELRNKADIHVFEASAQVGGRARQIRFGKKWVAGGAGIGRLGKDKRLWQLLQELDPKLATPFPHSVNYIPDNGTQKDFIKRCIAKLERHKPTRPVTFQNFIERVLGKSQADAFVRYLGFSDDLQADALETLKHYGFEDNFDLGRGIRVPWNRALRVLETKLRNRGVKIHKRHPVTRLEIISDKTKVICACPKHSTPFDHVFLAGTYESNMKLIRASRIRVPTFKNLVRSQPFMYIYAQVRRGKQDMKRAVNSFTVLTEPKGRLLQKMIPMGGNTYMVAYADNERAVALRSRTKNSKLWLVKKARQVLGIPHLDFSKTLRWFIPVGTHYFRPDLERNRSRTQILNDMDREFARANVTVIGEAVSAHNQGWVEGALEAADRGFHKYKQTNQIVRS
jgi:phytoene dehydrogenase-like protein